MSENQSPKAKQDFASMFEDDAGDDESSKKSGGGEDFAKMLADSLAPARTKFSVGDKVKGEILVAGKEEIFVAVGKREGIVPRREMPPVAEGAEPPKTGDILDLYVTQIKGSEMYLSPKPTAKNMADDLEDAFDMMVPVDGRVAEVCKGGFRVNIKGKLAFCPISQMDIKRIETPEEYIGVKGEFMITQFSEGGRNIVVSRRKVLEEQQSLAQGSFLEEHKIGEIVDGKVTRMEPFGAFVELAPGLDGLVHISELSWSRVAHPSEVISVGQLVRVKLLKHEKDGDRLRVSLSIKQAGQEPWHALPGSIAAGQMVEGKVTRIAKFGAFVELVPGVEGLIPLSEFSHTKRVMRAEEFVKEGDRVTVLIKDVSPETHRISLSLKDAGEDPWALVPSRYPVGSIVQGKVERREGYGLFVRLDENIVGLLPKSKALESPEFNFDKYKVNDPITVQVAEIRREERRISLGAPGDASAGDWQEYSAKQAPASGGGLGTFADLFAKAAANKGDAGKKKK